MKTRSLLKKTSLAITVLSLVTLAIVVGVRRAGAQDQLPPPSPDRISFGMVGITSGQTVRLSVVAIPYDSALPPGPVRVALTFLDTDGNRFRHRDGTFIRKVVMLNPNNATSLDLNADELQLPPSPIRLQLRALVTAVPPPTNDSKQPPPVGDRLVSSVEVFNNNNSRTVVFIGNPGVIRGFNPQPDPPVEGQ